MLGRRSKTAAALIVGGIAVTFANALGLAILNGGIYQLPAGMTQSSFRALLHLKPGLMTRTFTIQKQTR